MYKVVLKAELWNDTDHYEFSKEIQLPFPPFIGLDIDFCEWDSDGGVSKRVIEKFAAFGLSGWSDTPDFPIGEVVWSHHDEAFYCRPSEKSYYQGHFSKHSSVDYQIKILAVFGFKVTEHYCFREGGQSKS
jgi:hypothetical protein